MTFQVHFIHAGEHTASRHAVFPVVGADPRSAAQRHAAKIEGEEGARLVLIDESGRPSVFTLERIQQPQWRLV